MFMSSVCIARPRGQIEDQIDNVLAIQLPNLLTAERRKALQMNEPQRSGTATVCRHFGTAGSRQPAESVTHGGFQRDLIGQPQPAHSAENKRFQSVPLVLAFDPS
jgi:hypothetical protein